MKKLGLLLAVMSCAPRGPIALSAAQLQSRASRSIPAAFDEAYDATWLTFEAAGWKVIEFDRRAGTLSTAAVIEGVGTGRAWSANVSQEGATVVITLLPRIFEGARDVTADMAWTLEGPGGEVERRDALFTDIVALVDSWRVHPELLLSNSRGEVDAVGLRLLVPGWAHFEFSTDRRTLVMQGAGKGLVPTLLYRIERRRPDADGAPVVHEALEHAFHAPGRVAEPSSWESARDTWGEAATGEVFIGSELSPRPVQWRAWEAGNASWVVRLVSACPPDTDVCENDVRRVIESAVNTAPLPGTRAR